MKLYKICNKISLLLHVLASAAGYFVMEAICRHSFIEAWNYMTQRPLVFAYNAAFIFTSSLIVYLFHRRVFWRVLVTLFWLILAIINGVLLLKKAISTKVPESLTGVLYARLPSLMQRLSMRIRTDFSGTSITRL